jgi:UDP-N-acetylmuramoyl-L-alanyl-D-glutamate--2,6-diaminopimelate ligase
MTVNLDHIISDLEVMQVKGSTRRTLTGITFDSRNAAPGVLFAAVRGTRSDGHDYIRQALASGSEVIVCEHLPGDMPEDACFPSKDSPGFRTGFALRPSVAPVQLPVSALMGKPLQFLL